MMVTHIGDHPLIGRFYVVPGADASLLSVAELTRLKNDVTFTADAVTIIGTHGLTIRGARSVHNQYELRRADLVLWLRGTPASSTPQALALSSNERQGVRTYSAEQRKRAAQVINIHETCGHLSDDVLISAFDNGVTIGCRLTGGDVRNARDIYGRVWLEK
jgi:hypothetical protein